MPKILDPLGGGYLSSLKVGSDINLSTDADLGDIASCIAYYTDADDYLKIYGFSIEAEGASSDIDINLNTKGNGKAYINYLTGNRVLLSGSSGEIISSGELNDGEILIGRTGNYPISGEIISSRDLNVDLSSGLIDITLNDETNKIIHGWNGSILESSSMSVSSDGSSITFSIEKSGGGDLTVLFSDGFFEWDTSPADSVTLTAGSDSNPELNYVYFLKSSKALAANTTGWPSSEHVPLAEVLCQSAASVQTDEVYKFVAWTDNIVSSDDQGHLTVMNRWIRGNDARYVSGVVQTLSITTNAGAPDDVIFTTTSGVVGRLSDHVFPAFSGTPDLYVTNDSSSPYTKINNLNTLLVDSNGDSMSGRCFSLVIWGVVSDDSSTCKLMVNLPSGSYGNTNGVRKDINKSANYSIPLEFKGSGFLISELKLEHNTANGGTWSTVEEVDLRGFYPNSIVGFESVGNYFVWEKISSSQSADTQTGYICDTSGGAFSVTLPATASSGDMVRFLVSSSNSLTISQNAGQTIHFAGSSTTTGVGGSLQSTDTDDSVELICSSDNTDWHVISSIGNWTIT